MFTAYGLQLDLEAGRSEETIAFICCGQKKATVELAKDDYWIPIH